MLVSGKVGIAVNVGGRVEAGKGDWVGVGVGITLRSGANATAISPRQYKGKVARTIAARTKRRRLLANRFENIFALHRQV